MSYVKILGKKLTQKIDIILKKLRSPGPSGPNPKKIKCFGRDKETYTMKKEDFPRFRNYAYGTLWYVLKEIELRNRARNPLKNYQVMYATQNRKIVNAKVR